MLIYRMFTKLLSWMALCARSHTTKEIEILWGSRMLHIPPTSGD